MAKKRSEQELIRGAIKYEVSRMNETGLSYRAIAERLNVSAITVSKWAKRDDLRNQKPSKYKRSKFTHKVKNFVIKMAKNRFSGIHHVSSRSLVRSIKRKFKIDIDSSTLRRNLKSIFGKPYKARKTHLVTTKNLEQRIEFCKQIIEQDIQGKDIFFTDEKIFCLQKPLNKQTNQIRLSKKFKGKFRKGDNELHKFMSRELPKFPLGFMVAAGISVHGPGQLIFCIGNIDTTCYKRTLDYYKDDITLYENKSLNENNIPNRLYLQQDNARCHTSNESMKYIRDHFKLLENWPANSPDLNPIEIMWSIISEKLYEKEFTSLEDLKARLVYLWNRIPPSLCESIISTFDKRVRQVHNKYGTRYYKTDKYVDKKSNRISWDHINDNGATNDQVQKIVFSNATLDVYRKKKIKQEDAKWNKLLKKLKHERAMLSKQNKTKIMDSSRTFNAFKSKMDEKDKVIAVIEDTKKKDTERLTNMSNAQFYESLHVEMRIKMVSTTVINHLAIDDKSTKISDNNENNDNLSVSNENCELMEVFDENVDSEENADNLKKSLGKPIFKITKEERKDRDKQEDIAVEDYIFEVLRKKDTTEDRKKFVFKHIYGNARTNDQISLEDLWIRIDKDSERVKFINDKGELLDIVRELNNNEKIHFDEDTKLVYLI